MDAGSYIVRAHDTIPHDINFSIKPGIISVPEVQQKLHLEIEKTLVVVRKLFSGDQVELDNYFNQLLSLAQAGLVQDNAQPTISLNALQQLKNEIIERKSAEVKNAYFKLLGLKSLTLGVPPLIVAFILKTANYFSDKPLLRDFSTFSNFLYVWAGCMLGIWISFGARKTILTFEELISIEVDKLEPVMRLLFTGSIAVVFSLLFYKQAIVIDIAKVSTKNIESDAFVAIIFGIILGLSEQILGTKITKKAASLFEKI